MLKNIPKILSPELLKVLYESAHINLYPCAPFCSGPAGRCTSASRCPPGSPRRSEWSGNTALWTFSFLPGGGQDGFCAAGALRGRRGCAGSPGRRALPRRSSASFCRRKILCVFHRVPRCSSPFARENRALFFLFSVVKFPKGPLPHKIVQNQRSEVNGTPMCFENNSCIWLIIVIVLLCCCCNSGSGCSCTCHNNCSGDCTCC